jgi:hypothetical protein
LSAEQPTFAVRENGLFLVFSLQLAAVKSVSPTASYLFCFAKISNQQKATPDRSKARNKINHLRRWGNSAAASVGGLKHSPA